MCIAASSQQCLSKMSWWNESQQIWIWVVFLISLFCILLLWLLLRGKHDGLSCLTTTVTTQRETAQIGIYRSLCQGGTRADGAEETAGEEESPASGWRLTRSEGSQGVQQTLPSLMTCPAAGTSARFVVAQMGWWGYQLLPYQGSRAAWTTKPLAATLYLNVRSEARTLCLLCTAPGPSSANRRSPTSCVSIRLGSSCQTRFLSSALRSVSTRKDLVSLIHLILLTFTFSVLNTKCFYKLHVEPQLQIVFMQHFKSQKSLIPASRMLTNAGFLHFQHL